MKSLKTILTIIVSISMLFCVCPIANADNSSKITISEGTKNGNVVTFTITVPSGAGLRGDATDDGVVNATDSALILNYTSNIIQSTELNLLNSDFNKDGVVDSTDTKDLNLELLKSYRPITLTGTLADASINSLKTSKNSNGTYKVELTLPEGKEGTIGIKVNVDAFVFSQGVYNESEVSSKLITVSKQTDQENQGNQENQGSETVDKKITISDGVKKENSVTFTITLPDESGFRGDVTDDGKINEQDVDKLTKYNLGTIKEINTITGDWDMDGAITASDTTMLSKALTTKYVPIKLEGTLANNSKLDISKIADGKYSVVVTIPADTKEGTIGVTLKKGAVIFKDHTTNEAISSKLFDIATNKDTNDQNNNNVKATDNTQAQTVLPKAGYKATILAVIAIVALFAVVGYRKYKNIDK
jgi:hypothetical protein